ncbi:MAG: alpha/beta hydrolase [Verrucomicrobiae bacterium]|nr:alpha/beta hydrolase [Verrucomicrobiae bacterium]
MSLILLYSCSTLVNAQEPAKKKKSAPLPPNTEFIRDIEYAVHDGVSLKLDLYLPEERNASKPLPVVIWVHGGGWLNGSKNNCPATWLAPEGFAVASIDYRLTDVAQWPGQIDDCYAAVRWLRKNAPEYALDPDHIGAWGSSAGGHLVALMGTRDYPEKEAISSRVQAICDWFGPSELLTMPPNVVSEKRSLEQVAKSNGAKLLGATVRDVPEKAKDASALDQVSKDDAPFLIMHGDADPGVPLEQSAKLHEKLTTAGVPSQFHIVKGAGHGGKEFQTDEVRGKVLAFFRQFLQTE